MEKPEHRTSYFGCIFAFALTGIGYAILAPVFLSARSAARSTLVVEGATRLAKAVCRYADTHKGHLPEGDWKLAFSGIDPGLRNSLRRVEGDWHTGFAAVPGTQGKSLDSLSRDRIVYVQYRTGDDISASHSAMDIGDPFRTQSAVIVSVSDLVEWPRPRFLSSSVIAYLLGRQGVRLED